MHRVITNIGSSKHIDVEALTAFEATAMSVIAILAVTAGTAIATALS